MEKKKLFITRYEHDPTTPPTELVEFTSEDGIAILVIAPAAPGASLQKRCEELRQAALDLLWPCTNVTDPNPPQGVFRYEQPADQNVEVVAIGSETGLRVRITAPRQQRHQWIEARCKALAADAARALDL